MNVKTNEVQVESGRVGTPRRRRPLPAKGTDGAARRPCLSSPMKMRLALAAVAGSVCAAAFGQTAVVTHAELQAVQTNGASDWAETLPFKIQGVILNDPEEMLDVAFNPEAAFPPDGGQYQMFIQAAAEGDRGGTALYMAQRSVMGDHYDEATWSNELQRVMFAGTGRKFRKGDRVEVTARKAVFYNGKRNVNEMHRTTYSNDFDVALVQANVGLPAAEAITLADLKDADDRAIFDPARESGGEHWQGMRVRLDGIRLADTNGWGQAAWSNRICIAADATGRTLPLRLPRTDLRRQPPATSDWFSAVGILNQESDTWIDGYELFVQEIGPVLHVAQGPHGGVAVQFTTDYEDFVLEATTNLEGGIWSPVDVTPVRVILMEDFSAEPNRNYRLRKRD